MLKNSLFHNVASNPSADKVFDVAFSFDIFPNKTPETKASITFDLSARRIFNFHGKLTIRSCWRNHLNLQILFNFKIIIHF